MKIAMEYQSKADCREVFRQTKQIQEHADYIVPDVLEDLGQIASAEAQICLKSKELVDHGVQIGAQAEISVFYITEERNRVRCMRFTKPIETQIDCPALDPDSVVQLTLVCQGVQARAVNPRKISVQLALRVDLSCWAAGSLDIPTEPGTEMREDLQLLRKNAKNTATVQLGEKSFVVSEQLPLDTTGEPCAIVCARAEVFYSDCQIIGSKALIKGGAQLRIGYETEGSTAPQFSEHCLPFSLLIDMPDENCVPGRILLQPTALYTELSDAINGSQVVDVELHAVAQVSFEKEEILTYICDAYSTRCPVSAEECVISICSGREKDVLHADTTERIKVERDRGLVAAVQADILSFAARDGKAVLSVAVSLLLQTEDGSFSALQRLISFDSDLFNAECELVCARVVSLTAERQEDEIQLKLSCEAVCLSGEYTDLHCLSSLDLDTENTYDPGSMPSFTLIRKAGREMWEIAKAYRSSAEAIEAISERYAVPGDLLLIPRV